MCRFFSSNLDEFFMVRVAGLLDQAAPGIVVQSADGLAPRVALQLIRQRVLELTGRQAKLWRKQLRPALAAEEITDRAGRRSRCRTSSRELAQRFEQEIFPVLTPLGVGPGQPFPYISGLSLSLAVLARDPDTDEERFARVKVPEGLPRFFPLGAQGHLLPLGAGDRALPRPSLSGDGDPRASGLPGHAGRRLRAVRTTPTICSRPSRPSSGAAASATSSGSRSPARPPAE